MEISQNFATPLKTTNQTPINKIEQKAKELEGVFLNTLMSQMFSSIKSDGMFGGGYGEETWRSMQSEQYANLLSENGGIGLADQIMSNLLAIQENAKIATPLTMAKNIYPNSNTNEEAK